MGSAGSDAAAVAAEGSARTSDDTQSEPGSADQGGAQAQVQSQPAPKGDKAEAARSKEGAAKDGPKEGAGSKGAASSKAAGNKPKLPRPGVERLSLGCWCPVGCSAERAGGLRSAVMWLF